ncbi:MAG: tetratricopeptide repeat protein, partial [Planctomycetales bacterium]|nr:tetratricopeptide repeat protein [Planctomycetales bacterium]
KATPEQHAEAEQVLTLAMMLDPADWQLQSVYAESIQKNAPDRALLIRQRLLQSAPTSSNAVLLANMAMRMAQSEPDAAKKTGLIGLAGKAYQQAMEIDPDNETIQQAFADYLRITQQQEKALELLKDDQNLLWKFYLRGGQFEQAEAILKDLLQKKADDPLLLQGLILASEGGGKREQVKEYLDMLAKLEQTKDGELWVLQKYVDHGFSAEAEKKLASFKDRYPDEKTALLVEAWTAMGYGRLDEALSLTNRYLETEADNAGAWRLRGRLHRLMNQPQKAIDDLQRSKNLMDNPAIRMELANVYSETQQVTAAIGELASGLDDPEAPMQIRSMLETLYQKNNRAADLDKFYQATFQKYPQSIFWRYRAGMYYLGQKDYTRAHELLSTAWKMACEQDQRSIDVANGYLECLYSSQQYDKAFSFASEMIDTPAATLAYAFMGQIQTLQGQKDKAIDSFKKAMDKAQANENLQEMVLQKMIPCLGEEAVAAWISSTLAADAKSLPALLLACRLEQLKGSYNKAIEYADRCLEVVGADSPAWFGYTLKKTNLLIMAYIKTADQDYLTQATGLFEKMLQRQPMNASLLNNLAYLLVDNNQKLETAVDYARKAHQLDPGNPVYLDTYAYAQCRTGQYEQAEQNLVRSLQLYEASRQPVPWDFYKHLGMAREGLNKPQQAVEAYQKAMDASAQIPEKEKQQIQNAIERLRQQ